MNGPRLVLSTTSFSKRSSDYQTSGLSYSRSTYKNDRIPYRMAFGLVTGGGDIAIKLAAW
jgi:hypothetical protein